MAAKQKAAKTPAGENGARGVVAQDGNEVMGWGEVIFWSFCALAAVLVAAILHSNEKYYEFFVSVGALATASGVLFAAWTAKNAARNAEITAQQLKDSNRLTSVNFIAQALKEFAADNDMQRMYYSIEYNWFRYIPAEFHETRLEQRLDKLLRHFSVVALAWRNNMIENADMELVRYYVLRIMGDSEVREYLKFLRRWTKRAGLGRHPYEVLFDLEDYLLKNPPDDK